MKTRTALLWLIGLLGLVALACAQSGEIITPEEATRRAEEAAAGLGETGGAVDEAELNVGDQAILGGRGFLVNLLDAPGGKISGGQERGATVEIMESVLHEGEVWYRIAAGTGEGWVAGDNLEPAEPEAPSGPQPGDTVYLTGQGFLINLVEEPGSLRFIANQERGAEVVILEVTQLDGAAWYLVDAPTGEGWVPAENITTEVP